MGERNVLQAEVMQAIVHGLHSPKRDRFNVKNQSWAYCIEGLTIDKRPLRIGVSFEYEKLAGELLLIITVIDTQKN